MLPSKKKSENQADDINSTIQVDLKESKVDMDSRVIRNVAILGKSSHDASGSVRRTFSDNALNEAVSIFEGALARLDHDRTATAPRGVKTAFGAYQNVKRVGDKIFGDLVLWACPEADKVLSIAAKTPNVVGNSIHAGGKIRSDGAQEIVESLLPRTRQGFKAAVDLVDDPAATTNLFESKENEMDWTKITLDELKANRSDIYEAIVTEGKTARDSEVKDLTESRTAVQSEVTSLKTENDTLKAKIAGIEKAALVEKVILESKMPAHAVTDVFKAQLMEVVESKDSTGKVITVEDGMKILVKDRINATKTRGVHGNGGKEIFEDKNDLGPDMKPETFASALK